MSAISLPLLRDFGDRFSPIVVKELRQGLRTRLFTAAIMLFHSFVILLLGSVLLEAPIQTVNEVFWGGTGLMLLVVLPLRAFNALHSESNDGTLDMLMLTSISAFRILYGKWLALFSQSLLVAGSVLPYMVARYYFGGVEILRESMALLVLVLGSGLITAALLAFSSQPSLLLRVALMAGIGFAASPLGFFTAFLVTSSKADFMLRNFAALQQWHRWSIVVGMLALCFYTMWYFLALGASRIAPPSENHSTRKRVIVAGVHAALMIIGLLLCWLSADRQSTVAWAAVPLLFLTLIVCMDVLTEEMPRFPTALAGLAARGRWGWLLHPGWASGVFFSSVMCLMALVSLVAHDSRRGYRNWDNAPSLHFLCVLLAVFVPVLIRLNRHNIFANWWMVQISMVTLGVLGVLLARVSDAVTSDFGWLGVVTPVTTLFGVEAMPYHNRGKVLQAGCILSLLWLGAAMVRARMHFGEYAALEAAAQQLQPSTIPTP